MFRGAPIPLFVPVLLCAACGRIGYTELDDPRIGTAGGGGTTSVGVTTTSSTVAGSQVGSGGSGGAGGNGGSAGGGGGSTGGGGGADSGGGGGDSGPVACTAASFNGHRYLLCKTYLTQPDAAAQCVANGMRLAKVEDALENQWIVDTLHGPVLPADSGANWIWVGGSDAATEGSWLWPDGALFYQNGPVGGFYTNWGPAEPNNGRGGEDCLAERVNYRWTDLDCAEMHDLCCEEYP